LMVVNFQSCRPVHHPDGPASWRASCGCLCHPHHHRA
jgi:hypothetical protein